MTEISLFQAQKKLPNKASYILTHATSGSKVRGKGTARMGMWTQDAFRLDF